MPIITKILFSPQAEMVISVSASCGKLRKKLANCSVVKIRSAAVRSVAAWTFRILRFISVNTFLFY